ncbi:(deoxy)nucleoside triphosphate pyrophosphohydrolase [Cyclobacterium qasimii]|nr:(deoxy)nucleoside triphosphate pyrophosphohydrolase [Cyclobacterium qasimii]
MKNIEVVAGIIFHEELILCVQKPKSIHQYISEKFEFPGGKIEAGETKEEALHRELQEELSLSASIKSLFLTVTYRYPDFELTMHGFICEVDTKALTLHEHIHHEWLPLQTLHKLDWAAADIPIVEKLMAIKSLDSIGIKAKK